MATTGIKDSQLKQLTTANKVALSALDIDGATAIGEALVDADLFIVDNGAGGTNRKITAAAMQDYFSKVDILEDGQSQSYQIVFASDDNEYNAANAASYSAFQTSRLQESTVSSSTTSLTFSPEYGVSAAAGLAVIFTDSSSNKIAFTFDSSVSSSATSVAVTYNEGLSNATSMSKSSISSVTSVSKGSGDGKLRVDGSHLTYNPSTNLLTVGGDISVGDDLLLASDSAVLSLGAGADVTLTHDGSTGATLASAGAFILDGAGAVTVDSDAALTLGGASLDIDADGGAIDIDATGAVSIDSSAGSITLGAVLADGQTLKLGKNGATEMIFTPHGTAGSEKISLVNTAGTADDAIKIDAEAGGVTIAAGNDSLILDADGTDADAIDIDSAGGIDIDATTAINIATSGAAGDITLVSAHTAGVAFHIDANANAASEVQIDAGILDMDVTGAATLDAGGAIGITGAGVDVNAGSSTLELTTSGAMDLNSGAMTLDASSISLDGSGAVNVDTTDTSNGISIGTATSGVPISIGHGTSEVTVNDNLTVTGDLTINGATTTVSTTNMVVEDKFIELGNGVSGSPSGDAGFVIERGSSDNAAVIWDESADEFFLGTGSVTGASSGDLSLTAANLQAAVVRSSKLEVDSASDHIDMSGGNLVVTAGTSSADIVFAAAGGNVKPSADSSVSLGQAVSSSLDSSASSYSAFQTSRLQESTLTSSTSSLTFSPEYGTTASAGEVVIFNSSAGTLAFEFDANVSSSATSVSVSHNSSNSSVTSMNKSDITSVTRKQLTTTGAAWATLYADNIDLDGQGRIDLDDDQDTSIRSSADDQIDFEVGGSDVMVLTNGSLVLKGTTPKITIGDAGAEDTMLVFDGNAQDYRVGLDDGTDILEFGVGSTHGTTVSMKMDASLNVDVAGHNGSVGLKLGGTLVSASAAELNLLDASAGSSVALASGDAVIIGDASDSNATKKVLLSDLATLLSGAGLTQSGATLSINVVRDSYVQATATSGNTVCTLSAEPINEAAVDVYLNGVLQTPAGSQSPGDPSEVDYTYGGSSGSRTITFPSALLSDDVVNVKYIAKSE